MDAKAVRRCLSMLERIDRPQYRPDTRRAAKKAREVIAALVEAAKPVARNSLGRDQEAVALRIAHKAREGAVVLYLAPDGDYRWRWAGNSVRGEIIGTYGAEAHWEDILEDMQCS